MMAFFTAMMQGAQAQTGADAAAAPMMAAAVNSYIDIFSKQLDRALVFAKLEPNGLHLSALVTFQPDTAAGQGLRRGQAQWQAAAGGAAGRDVRAGRWLGADGAGVRRSS